MRLDAEACRRAVSSRDERFDGWFYTGVTTTGIYCRPSCPAMTPHARHMEFYPSAAGAQRAGYRACKRCRPDASPGSPEWNVRQDAVARAMRMIADGVVDTEGVSGLARRLGYSPRQVERLMLAEVGAGPLALARAQRAQTARTLVEGTTLSLAEVAFAAGFASIRSFNETVRTVYALTPRELRRRGDAAARSAVPAEQSLTLRLAHREPLHVPSLFGHLAGTAVPGLERWHEGGFERTLHLPHGPGWVRLVPRQRYVEARLSLTDLKDLTVAVNRCRRLLDLDADPMAVDLALSADPALRPLVAAAAGVRLAGTVDPHELALRVVIGQQVSTASAATTTSRLVRGHRHRAAGRPGPAGHQLVGLAAGRDVGRSGTGRPGLARDAGQPPPYPAPPVDGHGRRHRPARHRNRTRVITPVSAGGPWRGPLVGGDDRDARPR